jgi:UDP-N-acetylmuramoyl-L-alanyl-D-glutamate--2,6-diaminopimelate ligase
MNSSRKFSVVIDYAHTDDALRNVLLALNELKTGKIITVFGCGGDRDTGKRPKMGQVAGTISDYVIVTSDNPRTEEPKSIIEEIVKGLKKTKVPFETDVDRRSAIGKAVNMASQGDIVLIAGKGHEDYQIIGETRSHFSDSEVVAEFLKSKEGSTINI